MDNRDQFLADFPYKLFIEEEADWFQQTVEEAKHMFEKAQAKRKRIRARNLKNKAAGGFLFENDMNLDRGPQYYTSQRGERRRYQLNRS